MFLTALYLWTVLRVVLGDNHSCVSGFQNANTGSPINFTESCNEKSPCINKCCPVNQILVRSNNHLSCVDNNNITAYNIPNLDGSPEIEFYENNIEQNVKKSKKKMNQFIQIYNDDFRNDSCSIPLNDYYKLPTFKIYLLENGSSIVRQLNALEEWVRVFQPDMFCVERQIKLDHWTVSKPELVIRMFNGSDNSDDGDESSEGTDSTVAAIGLLVSCVFLVLVLAVYALLPQLRNMAGVMQMAYVATLITAFIIRAPQIIYNNSDSTEMGKSTCIWIGLMSHYAVIASFTWMNVMAFDIWRTMSNRRGFRKPGQTHLRGVLVRLGWYGLYGWGAPLGLMVFMVVVENLDLTHLPRFIKPHYSNPQNCFMAGEILLYLTAPIVLTTCINLAFFLLTAYNVWRIKHAVSRHAADTRTNKKDEAR